MTALRILGPTAALTVLAACATPQPPPSETAAPTAPAPAAQGPEDPAPTAAPTTPIDRRLCRPHRRADRVADHSSRRQEKGKPEDEQAWLRWIVSKNWNGLWRAR